MRNKHDGMVQIYRLIDPIDGAVRYVGITNDPPGRMVQHLAAYNGSEGKRQWLRALKSQGLVPRMEIIEECPAESEGERERHWIAYHASMGDKLLNGNGVAPILKVALPPAVWGRLCLEAERRGISIQQATAEILAESLN